MSKLSHGELLSLIFTNPFVSKQTQLAAMDEYRRRMKTEIYDADAIEFISEKSGVNETVVVQVLRLYEDYMKGVIKNEQN